MEKGEESLSPTVKKNLILLCFINLLVNMSQAPFISLPSQSLLNLEDLDAPDSHLNLFEDT